MTIPSALSTLSTLLAASSKKSSSSSSELPFLLIILAFVAVYFFFLRPRQQRAKAQANKGKAFGIGDEVMSVGGIYGRVVGLGDDSVDVEVAPDVVLTFLRRAVNPRPASAVPADPPGDASPHDDPDRPYGGSAGSDDTSFGASSGHFDETGEEDGDDFEDFDEDVEQGELDEDDDGDDGRPRSGGNEVAGGSATGLPRTTGGAGSEEG